LYILRKGKGQDVFYNDKHSKLNSKETGCDDVDRTYLAYESDQWQAVVITVMKFPVSKA
jgi:hypothetical protein